MGGRTKRGTVQSPEKLCNREEHGLYRVLPMKTSASEPETLPNDMHSTWFRHIAGVTNDRSLEVIPDLEVNQHHIVISELSDMHL